MTAECDSLDMSCLPSTKAHKGIMQAAEYVKGKLEENNRLQMAFQKAQVGHYTVQEPWWSYLWKLFLLVKGPIYTWKSQLLVSWKTNTRKLLQELALLLLCHRIKWSGAYCFCPVCLFVCLLSTLTWTVRDTTAPSRDFKFGMHTHLMMPFQMTARPMTLWPWLLPLCLK